MKLNSDSIEKLKYILAISVSMIFIGFTIAYEMGLWGSGIDRNLEIAKTKAYADYICEKHQDFYKISSTYTRLPSSVVTITCLDGYEENTTYSAIMKTAGTKVAEYLKKLREN